MPASDCGITYVGPVAPGMAVLGVQPDPGMGIPANTNYQEWEPLYSWQKNGNYWKTNDDGSVNTVITSPLMPGATMKRSVECLSWCRKSRKNSVFPCFCSPTIV